MFDIFKSKNQNEYGYLVNNLFKTAGSTMDNIAEGFERDGNKEFRQFLSISKGSSGELKSQLYRAMNFELISQDEFNRLSKRNNIISKQLGSLMNYLKSSKLKGRKFAESISYYNIKTK